LNFFIKNGVFSFILREIFNYLRPRSSNISSVYPLKFLRLLCFYSSGFRGFPQNSVSPIVFPNSFYANQSKFYE